MKDREIRKIDMYRKIDKERERQRERERVKWKDTEIDHEK